VNKDTFASFRGSDCSSLDPHLLGDGESDILMLNMLMKLQSCKVNLIADSRIFVVWKVASKCFHYTLKLMLYLCQ